jgi:hypothetical protein
MKTSQNMITDVEDQDHIASDGLYDLDFWAMTSLEVQNASMYGGVAIWEQGPYGADETIAVSKPGQKAPTEPRLKACFERNPARPRLSMS